MEIIVEVLARHGRVRERHRLRGETIQIGRSYASDLILGDPYVCPHHLQVQFDAANGQWWVQDRSVRNGTFLVGTGRLQQPHVLRSGDEFDLGETRIRILLPRHEIPATRHLPSRRMLADYLASPLTALGLLVCTLGLFAFAQHLDLAREAKLQELLLKALMFLAVPFVWACVWGLIGRVAVHDARFAFHLSMGSLLVVTAFLLTIVADYLGYGLGNEELTLWFEMIGEGVLMLGFLLAGLLMATQMQRLRRWMVAGSIAGALVSVSLLSYMAEPEGGEHFSLMTFPLKPPFARLQPVVEVETFLRDVETVWVELDQAEAKENAP